MKGIILSLLLLAGLGAQAVTDSIGLKIFSNNKVFIVHQVEKGQTLYRISKRYKVEPKDINAYNPDVATNGLKVEQYIFIPTQITPSKATALINSADKRKEAIENGTVAPENREDNVVYYTVKAGETLFSISRLKQCEFTIDEIKRWNDLKSNSLEEGQRLIIGFREKVKTKTEKVDVGTVKEIVEGDTSTQDTTSIVWNDIRDEGLAKWMPDGADDNGKSYALYNKAPMGTVIRIENLNNEKVTYARVIGPIPKQKEKDVIIVLTEAAANKLAVKDDVFRVEVIFSDDQL